MIKIFKILGVLAIVAAVSLAGLGLVVRSKLDPRSLGQTVEKVAGERLGRRVSVAAVELDWTGGVRVRDLKVSDRAGTSDQITVASMDGRFSLSGILTGALGLASLTIDRPILLVTRLRDGHHDLEDVIESLGKAPAGGGPTMTVLPTLRVRSGQVTLRDEANQATHVAKDLDLCADLVLQGPIPFELTGTLDGRPAAIAGSVDPAGLVATLSRGRLEGLAPGLVLGLSGGRVAFQGEDRRIEGLVFDLAGSPGRLDLTLRGTGALEGKLEAPAVALPALGHGISTGRATVTLALAGTLQAPKLTGEAHVETLTMIPEGSGATLRVPRARLEVVGFALAPPRVSVGVHDTRIEVDGLAVPVLMDLTGGRVDVSPAVIATRDLQIQCLGLALRPRLEIRLDPAGMHVEADTGKIEADLAKVLGMLPPERREALARFRPEGGFSGSLAVDGPVSAPRIRGRLDLAAIRMALPGGDPAGAPAVPITVGPGALVFGGDSMEVQPIRVVHPRLEVQVSGRVESLLSEPRFQLAVKGRGLDLAARGTLAPDPGSGSFRFQDATVEGTAEGGALAADARIQAPVQLALRLSGSPTAPRIEGTATGAELAFLTPSGGRLAARGVKVVLAGTPEALDLDPISGTVASGRLSGKARAGTAAPPSFDLAIADGSLQTLVEELSGSPDLVEGWFAINFAGRGTPATLEGQGQVRATGMVLKLGRNRAMALLGLGLKAGERSAGYLAQHAGETLMGRILDSGSRGAGFFKGVVDILSLPIELGDFQTPLAAEAGRATVGRFEAPVAAGILHVNLAGNLELSGHLDHITLGRVGLREVGLGGTLTAPVPAFSPANLMLDGEAAPLGIAELGSILGGKGLGETVQKRLKGEAGKVLQGALGRPAPAPGEESGSGSGGSGLEETGKKLLKGLFR